MNVHVLYASLPPYDVVLLYDSAIVFSSATDGTRYVAEQAARGEVPFATLSVPQRLQRSPIIPRLGSYDFAYNDVFGDKFVFDRFGRLFSAQFDEDYPVLPEQNFWRSLAALYRAVFESDRVEW